MGTVKAEYDAKRSVRLWDYIARQSDDAIIRGGWRNSYTGKPFTMEEMAEYSENVYLKLKDYLQKDTVVLEIGCASGITMYRLAPFVKKYIGTDMASVNLKKNQQYNEANDIKNIELIQCGADEIKSKITENIDLVIINSVVQYFPSLDYLENVITQAITILNEAGTIYLGDLRDKDKKEAFVKSIKNYQKEHGQSEKAGKNREELMLSRDYCAGLQRRFPSISSVTVSDKIGSIDNELLRYRFDALCAVKK